MTLRFLCIVKVGMNCEDLGNAVHKTEYLVDENYLVSSAKDFSILNVLSDTVKSRNYY